MPVLLTYFGKKSGVKGGRSLTYVLGNMLSAGGTKTPPAGPLLHPAGTEVVSLSFRPGQFCKSFCNCQNQLHPCTMPVNGWLL